MLIIRTACSTVCQPSTGSPPMRCEGESGVKLRMSGFQINQLAHEAIIFLIRDTRLGEDVIEIIVMIELGSQFFDSLLY
jgi:hypothetical protein